MSAFTYVASTVIVSGHVENTVYSVDLPIAKYELIDKIDGKQQLTNSRAETIFNGFVSSSVLTTAPLSESHIEQARELLLSAMDGQQITFDVRGSVGSPVNPRTGVIKQTKNLRIEQSPTRKGVYTFEILDL